MLTLQFVPYHETSGLSSDSKLKKLLRIVKTGRIVLMEGRLNAIEETKLIEMTMEQIDKKFKGVEVCTVYPNQKGDQLFEKLKLLFYKMLLGNREGLTIIGPATIVKEVKKDPTKIEIFTKNVRKRRGN
jgi:hypothetical protein